MRRGQHQSTKFRLVKPKHQFPSQHGTLAGDNLDAPYAVGVCSAQETEQRTVGPLRGMSMKVERPHRR
jgi:hypothetical protein